VKTYEHFLNREPALFTRLPCHAPANFCTIKHMAQNLARRAPGKTSMRQKRKAAGWDDDCLASLIAQ